MIAELLDATPSPKEIGEYVHLLRIATERLLSGIDKEKMLLDSPMLALAKCDAREILEELLRDCWHEAFARNRRLEIVGDLEERVELLTDKTLLLRVLDNLLRNAEEATGPEGLVTIAYRRVGREVEFSVHNPTTMPENVCSDIFNRPVSTKGEGRGLGMRGIKILSEKYLKGTVAFSSTAEHGTTFSVRCPACSSGTGAIPSKAGRLCALQPGYRLVLPSRLTAGPLVRAESPKKTAGPREEEEPAEGNGQPVKRIIANSRHKGGCLSERQPARPSFSTTMKSPAL